MASAAAAAAAADVDDVNVDVDGEVIIGSNPSVSSDKLRQPWSLYILPTVREAQSIHGLRHQDFSRYRAYCTRRLARIHSSLGYVSSKNNRYKKLPVVAPEAMKDVRWLQALVASAERAWAYAMEDKQEMEEVPRKRHHMLRRLAKATRLAAEVEALASGGKCDARTALEGEAYNRWMTANFHFEKQEWEKALEGFVEARAIYERLATACSPDVRDTYKSALEELNPSIRYCAYNLDDNAVVTELIGRVMCLELSSKLDAVVEQTNKRHASDLKEISLCNRTVSVRTEKIRAVLLRAKELRYEADHTSNCDRQRLEFLDKLVMAYLDAASLVRDEVREVESKNIQSIKSAATLDDLSFLLNVVTYWRLAATVERNVTLVKLGAENYISPLATDKATGKASHGRPDDLARLYDTALQNVVDMSALDVVEANPYLTAVVATHTMRFKTWRCFYKAESYAAARSWSEAMALYDRAAERLTSTQSHLEHVSSTIGSPDDVKASSVLPVSNIPTELTALETQIRIQRSALHAARVTIPSDGIEAINASATAHFDDAILKRPVLDRLDHYAPLGTGTGSLAPDWEPVSCKPLFFDLALNNIQFPDIKSRVKSEQGNSSNGGLTGLVKGLWGWR